RPCRPSNQIGGPGGMRIPGKHGGGADFGFWHQRQLDCDWFRQAPRISRINFGKFFIEGDPLDYRRLHFIPRVLQLEKHGFKLRLQWTDAFLECNAPPNYKWRVAVRVQCSLMTLNHYKF